MDSSVDYFEDGCLCPIAGRIQKPKENKLEFYLANCKCSRHPESATRDCWDRDYGEGIDINSLIANLDKGE